MTAWDAWAGEDTWFCRPVDRCESRGGCVLARRRGVVILEDMRFFSWLPCVLVVACGGNVSSAAPDAGRHHDAGAVRDAATGKGNAAPDTGGPSRDARSDVSARDSSSGDAPIGAPCSSADQCLGYPCLTCGGTVCLGAPFSDGYCTVTIAECSAPGGVLDCPDGSICDNGVEAMVDGKPGGGDVCLARCGASVACRAGYSCCSVRGQMVCAPPTLCGT
jgi:hypothetical protein